jgi:AcrR family transcriptional regulator
LDVNPHSFLGRMAYRRTPAVVTRLEDNRARILSVARDLVAEGGWRHAHVATVAEKAGVATGTVYRYFPSKAELFAEVLANVSRRERDVVAAIVDGDGTPATRLQGAVKAFAKRALQGRRLAHAMIVEPCEPAIDQARLEWRANLGEEFVRLVEMGQAEGAFRACEPRIAAACVVGAFMEALVGPLTPDAFADAKDAQRLIEEIADNCLAVVSNPSVGSVSRVGRTA